MVFLFWFHFRTLGLTRRTTFHNRKYLAFLAFAFAHLLFLPLLSPSLYAQSEGPVIKENLLRSLERGKTHPDEISVTKWVQIIKQRGVNFQLTLRDEMEIRKAGEYLGPKGLDELLAAIGTAGAPGGTRLRISVFNSETPCADYRLFEGEPCKQHTIPPVYR